MSFVTATSNLYGSLMQLERTFDHLYWASAECQPPLEAQHVLVSYYETAATDLLGAIRPLRETMTEQQNKEFDCAAAQQLALRAQTVSNQIHNHFYQELLAFEQINGLNELGQQQPELWASWTCGVLDALSECHQPLYELNQLLFECWEELITSLAQSNEQSTKQAYTFSKEKLPTLRAISSQQHAK